MTAPVPDHLAAPLRAILDAELAAGNIIAQVSSWPPTCTLLVVLSRPFHRRYDRLAEVEYAHIGDPHYWQDEYNYPGGIQTLAAAFPRAGGS